MTQRERDRELKSGVAGTENSLGLELRRSDVWLSPLSFALHHLLLFHPAHAHLLVAIASTVLKELHLISC